MDVSTLQRLDANILLGIINEKLRLECDGLEELLAYYDMTEDQLAHPPPTRSALFLPAQVRTGISTTGRSGSSCVAYFLTT